MAGGRRELIFLLIFLNFLKCRTHVDPVTDSNMVNAKITTRLAQICLAVSSYSGINTSDLNFQLTVIHLSVVPERGGLCQAKACGDCYEATSPCCSF